MAGRILGNSVDFPASQLPVASNVEEVTHQKQQEGNFAGGSRPITPARFRPRGAHPLQIQVRGTSSDAQRATSKQSESSINAAISSQEPTALPKASNRIASNALNEIFSTTGSSILHEIKRVGWTSANSSSERIRNKFQKMVGIRGDLHKVRDFIQYMASSSDHEQNAEDSTVIDYRRNFGSATLCLSVGRNEKGEINFAFLGDIGGTSSPSAQTSSHSKSPLSPMIRRIPEQITTGDLGEKIGSGGDKDVYQLETNPALVVALQRHDGYFSPDPNELHQEVELLNQLAELGFPVVSNYGVGKVGDRHGIFQDHIPGARVQYEPGIKENLNEQTLSDLDRIEGLLTANNVHIDDFQLLVGSDGRVFVVDPLRVEDGLDEANIAVIDELRALALNK